jgi:hypothetical protein
MSLYNSSNIWVLSLFMWTLILESALSFLNYPVTSKKNNHIFKGYILCNNLHMKINYLSTMLWKLGSGDIYPHISSVLGRDK